ncbi:MAG: glycosyltransferase [Paludibacteraceae bacterium]|jgi:glycosyltransferase involved in cell wall biosynthesis|nr:glycosyltransferase [Paludibacteraceae bacterium]
MISVCMATFNGAKYIKLQIDSILPQLSADDELIISDDESTDGTINIITSYQDARIVLLHHQKDEKLRLQTCASFRFATSNFENAIRRAKGEYIFLSDQDDVWHPNKVERMVQAMRSSVAVQCNCNVIDDSGNELQAELFPSQPFSANLLYNIKAMPFLGCCMAFRRDILRWVLPFPKGLLAHDFWIGAIVTQKGKIEYLPEVLHFYRKHGNNVSPASGGKSANSLIFKISYRIVFFVQILKRLGNIFCLL